MDAVLVVIISELRQLSLQIQRIPEERLVETLSPHGAYQAFDERMRDGRVGLRIPVKPITESGVKPIGHSGQADHLSERSDAGVGLCL